MRELFSDMPERYVVTKDLYDRLRSYLQHEDDLIHQRMTMMFTVETLVFAAYGYVVSEISDRGGDSLSLDYLRSEEGASLLFTYAAASTLFAFGGLLISIYFRSSVRAALTAMEGVRDVWDKFLLTQGSSPLPERVEFCQSKKEIKGWPALQGLFPYIMGGGVSAAAASGIVSAAGIPTFFVFIWSAIGTVSVASIVWVFAELWAYV